ncbi:MAG: murein L,D-transpeptidase catalytic domain family protein [Williamsia sp.]|nr:murein L,D-transpeptidase catalytic domain family protein [Williamsia sp.]
MRRSTTHILIVLSVLVSLSFIPKKNGSARKRAVHTARTVRTAPSFSSSLQQACSLLYDSLQLSHTGLSEAALEYAMKGFSYLQQRGLVSRNILSICDFSQSSRNKRLYVIDMESKKLLYNTYVAHGRNSGAEYATSFSNKAESLKSSLGFYVTEGTYMGSHGLSLKIEGLERGFNDNALKRNIVIHGCEYTTDPFVKSNSYCGRSYGCPAVPSQQSSSIIQTLKEGTCLFIYHPSASGYLNKSSILNS